MGNQDGSEAEDENLHGYYSFRSHRVVSGVNHGREIENVIGSGGGGGGEGGFRVTIIGCPCHTDSAPDTLSDSDSDSDRKGLVQVFSLFEF